MSAQPKYQLEQNVFRCFEVNIGPGMIMPDWLIIWRQQILKNDIKISYRHEEALARLIPFLLCGEQSAIHVFGGEVERLRNHSLSKSISLLKTIETDEYAHENALQTLSSLLMEPTDLRDIKRKARLFYLKLGNTVGMAEHFARVAQLDSCVCIIMNAITKSDLGKGHLITQLFERIKKDEARHVYVSNKHFQYLGGDRALLDRDKNQVSHQLVQLLKSESDSFESLGIDPDVLFNKLENAKQQ